MVLGTGWAPHRGGPLTYGREVGFATVVKTLTELARQYSPRFEPSSALRQLAEEKSEIRDPKSETNPNLE
jgi:hypothetical protein